MTRDDILRMARAVGWDEMGADLWGAAFDGAMSIHALERFASLVAAAEREACAKVCDAIQKKHEDEGAWLWEAKNCASAIRARSTK